MTLIVRQARASDLDSLSMLVEEYWRFESIDGFDATRVQSLLRSLIAEPLVGTVWVAENGERLAGYLVAVTVFSLEHGGTTAEIDELFVRPACRGSGAGLALLQAAEAHAAESGCRNISLQVGVTNAGARRFYRRAGYAERNGYDLLEKDLSGG